MIVPMLSYSSILQDSVLIDINHIRKANELIIEGQKYKELDSIKGSIIVEIDYQVEQLEYSIAMQDSIIISKNGIIENKDYLYFNKEEVLKQEIKKQKRQKIVSFIVSALLVVIAIF